MAMVGDSQQQIKQPDAVGNLFETEMQTDRHYAAGGQLTKDQHWHYHYDEEGNLTNKTPSPSEKVCESRVCEGMRNWSLGSWAYEWNANGSLKKVKCPDGKEVTFTYDALGRRIKKKFNNKIVRYLWDNNVILHEWEYNVADEPQLVTSEIGEVSFNKPEPINNLITWVYENGSFVPIGKLTQNESFSIVSDYIGRPVLAFDKNGEQVWSAEYDIYGRIRKLQGDKTFIPFRQLGQYEDVETGLYYNRFRYYDPNSGLYISQDPIGLLGNNPNFYAYVFDSNTQVDVFGLDCNRVNKARKRQHKMLQDNQGFNVSPIDWDIYPTIGRNGTFITDKKAISDYFGNFTDGETITISLKKATEIEKGMGLNPESLKNGFKVRKVEGISSMYPRSPLEGNSYFLGAGKHLPNGAPEMVIDSISTVDNELVTTILKVLVK